MTDDIGSNIPPEEAWRIFSTWMHKGHEIGVVLYASSGTSIYTMGVVESAARGRLLVKGNSVRASLNLVGATFKHGPFQTWPKWPSPPIVELMAVQAQLENGDWLALAEGLRAESLSPPALPEPK